MKPKRLFGKVTITLPDGYVEVCKISERGTKRYLERLKENIEIILKEAGNGNVKLNYRGPFAAGIYDFLKAKGVESKLKES